MAEPAIYYKEKLLRMESRDPWLLLMYEQTPAHAAVVNFNLPEVSNVETTYLLKPTCDSGACASFKLPSTSTLFCY